MSFTRFARDFYVRVLTTGETAELGTYTLSKATELDQILLWLNVQGTPGGSEILTLEVYGSSEAESPLYSSDPVSLSSVTFNAGEASEFLGSAGDFIGVVPFNFSREPLGASSYVLKLKSQNYTRNGDTYYIGWVFDNPEPVYSRTNLNQTGAKAIIIGYE